MEIRLMELKDVSQIVHLEQVCFTDPWSESSIASELSNPLSCWYVSLDGDRVIGYVGSQTVLDGADMMNVAVDPDYRRKGIAKQLIEQLVDGVKARGAICLMLEVRISNNPAIRLYEKMNFKVVGKRPNYYRNPREDALIMRKEW